MNRLLTLSLVFALLLGWAALAAPSAQAQTHASLVWRQLEGIYEYFSGEGYYTRNYIVGKLDDDETDTWTFTLFSGNDYAIVGACDGDCVDIDLAIKTEGGATVDSDTARDDFPIVRVSPRSTTRYRIEVKMYECNSEPCYFGIGIFYRN